MSRYNRTAGVEPEQIATDRQRDRAADRDSSVPPHITSAFHRGWFRDGTNVRCSGAHA